MLNHFSEVTQLETSEANVKPSHQAVEPLVLIAKTCFQLIHKIIASKTLKRIPFKVRIHMSKELFLHSVELAYLQIFIFYP